MANSFQARLDFVVISIDCMIGLRRQCTKATATKLELNWNKILGISGQIIILNILDNVRNARTASKIFKMAKIFKMSEISGPLPFNLPGFLMSQISSVVTNQDFQLDSQEAFLDGFTSGSNSDLKLASGSCISGPDRVRASAIESVSA